MRKLLAVFVVAIFWILPAVSYADATEADAKVFVERVGNDALSIIRDRSLSTEAKQTKLETMFRRDVDINWIGKFVVGKHWRTMNEEQKSDYMKLYSRYLVNSYVPNFKKYNEEKLEIKNITAGDAGEFLVETNIVRANNPQPLKVSYNIRYDKATQTYKIFDIIAEGVSLLVTQRSEFGSIIQRNGVDYLNNELERKIAMGNGK